jgi:hypothetical protein
VIGLVIGAWSRPSWEFYRAEGENGFPENHDIAERVNADITGSLHELPYARSDPASRHG